MGDVVDINGRQRDEDTDAMKASIIAMGTEEVDRDDSGEIVDKDYEAYRLRALSWSFQRIAKELGDTHRVIARERVMRYAAREGVSLSEETKEVSLALNISRLEALLASNMTIALMGDANAARITLATIQELNKLRTLYDEDKTDAKVRLVIIRGQEQHYVEQLKQIAGESSASNTPST